MGGQFFERARNGAAASIFEDIPMLIETMLSRLFHARLCRRQMSRRPTSREPRPGPFPIAMARQYAKDRADIRIDPLETELRIASDVIAVRAWVLVPVSDGLAQSPGMAATRRLQNLSPETQRIFYLSAGYGLPVAEISSILSLSRRRVRKHLMRAIAALDPRGPNNPAAATNQ